MNILIAEILRRKMKDEKIYDLIGSEIRIRRKKMNLTQELVSEDICSISYLSKIEHNEIKGNMEFLEEISRRLNFSRKEVKALIQSRDLFIEALYAYNRKNLERLEELCGALDGQHNYRSQILEYILHVYKAELNEASNLVKKLDTIVSTMSDEDLFFYALFRGLHLKLAKEYSESLELLKVILDNFNIIKVAKMIILNAIDEMLFYFNSRQFLTNNDENMQIQMGNFNDENLIKSRKRRYKYYVLNNMYEPLYAKAVFMNDKEYEELMELGHIINQDFKYDYKNEYFKLIALANTNRKAFLEYEIDPNLKLKPLEEQVLEYYRIKDSDDLKTQTYLDLCLNNAIAESNYYYINIFATLMKEELLAKKRYKRYYEITERVNKVLARLEVK